MKYRVLNFVVSDLFSRVVGGLMEVLVLLVLKETK